MKREIRLKCYQRDSGKRRQAEDVIEYILDNYKYGQTIPDSELAKILGYNITYTEQYKNYKVFMTKIKNELIMFNYILKAISGVGYYILRPEHIVGHCYNTYVKASQRKLDKSLEVSGHIDKTELSDGRKEEITNFRELNGQLIDAMDQLINRSMYIKRADTYELKEIKSE